MRSQQSRLQYPLTATQVESIDTMFETLFRGARAVDAQVATLTAQGLTGTKTYYVSDTSGGAVTRKLTFTNGILTAET